MINTKGKITLFLLSIFITSILNAQEETSVPVDLQAWDINEYSAHLSWKKDTNTLQYIIEYNAAMSDDITQVKTSDTTVFITDLVSATQYLWRVRAVSYTYDTTAWSNTASFYTEGYSTDCDEVGAMFVTSTAGNNITVQWTDNENVSYWEIVCDETGTNPDNRGRRYFTKETEYVFEDLVQGDIYQFALRSHCNSSAGNWKYVYAKFLRSDTLQDLPVSIDFDAEDYLLQLGLISSALNPWTVGYNQNTDEENKTSRMYVSNNNGLTNVFNNQTASLSYAYTDFFVPDDTEGLYIDFSYRGNIASENDGVKLYIVSNSAVLGLDTLPDGISQIGKTVYNNTEGEWKDEHIELSSEYAGSPRRLLFVWRNTDSCQDNLSVEIDNIYIAARYCAAPNNLKADYITHNSAMLSWNATDNHTVYTLEYRKISDTLWTQINGITNNYFLDSLEENSVYVYRLQANCEEGNSVFSQPDTFYTPLNVLPVDINTLKYTVKDTLASFTWDEVNDVKSYCVNYKENTDNSDWNQIISYVNSCTLKGLKQNTEYLFKVKCINFYDDSSAFTDTVRFITGCSSVKDFPYSADDDIVFSSQEGIESVPFCFSVGESEVISPVLDFTDIEAAELTFDIYSTSSVIVYASRNGGMTYAQLQNIPASGTQTDFATKRIVLSDYVMEDNVKIKLVFVTFEGKEDQCHIKNFTIKSTCRAPRTVEFDEISYNYITLSWTDEDMAESWLASLYDKDWNLITYMNVSTNHCTFSSLDTASTYKITVRSICSGNVSFDSARAEFTTFGEDVTQCSVPDNFTAFWYQTKSEETIMATWESPSYINVWEVWYKEVLAVDWQQRIVTINPVFTIRNLSDNDRYEIKVRAICSPGDTSDFTKTDTVTVRPSGLEEISSEEGYILTIYPNPADNVINTDAHGAYIKNAVLMSFEGKVLQRWEQLPEQINIDGLPAGTYFLSGIIDNRKITKRFIKK
ncbi:MAG: fibronectin type III domain-containing protein [Bacteroidales bacterium]|nr:fibronectin type III domain-containing protein [Bacteroidales bacterium]